MTGSQIRARRGGRSTGAWLCCAAIWLAVAAPAAAADSFNGRIAFSSVRTDPQAKEFDIFSMNSDGSDVRRLTTNPATDRQSDWSPHGTDLAYTIRKPNATVNFEVARMTANGTHHRQLTMSPESQASSQPAWLPDGRGILFRRSGPGRVSTIWQMGLFGQTPALRFAPTHPPLYPTFAPDQRRVAYAAILSTTGDTDRGVFTQNVDGSAETALFDVPGAYDSAPAWSPDGAQIAFESNADVAGGNPEHDMEVWVMRSDGSGPTQLTHNTAHDEGPAWSPDGRLLAYTSGPDDTHGDIHVMTARGRELRRLTSYENADESPDWQAIPAPRTDARCGGLARTGPGAYDVRRAGRGLTCADARGLVRRWLAAHRPRHVRGYAATATDFGGLRRVALRRTDGARHRLVAFLYQSDSTR
jgi:TolB protein